LTEYGDTLGTPAYMSPEQARGEDVGADADIWALCVLLYELVTGVLPFDARNQHAMLRAIIEDEPVPPSRHGIEDAAFSEIVLKGLAKPKADRWQSMRELGIALARWLVDQGYSDDVSGTSLRAAWLQSNEPGSSADVLSSIPPPDKVEPAKVVVVPERRAEPSQPVADEAGRSRAVRRSPPTWLVLVLWALALSGAAGAITGYLGVELPGVPARLP
jgi:serine/threonine-protein kinase